MAQVSLPYTLTAGTPENVNNLMSNLTALRDGVNTIDTAQLASASVTAAKLDSTLSDYTGVTSGGTTRRSYAADATERSTTSGAWGDITNISTTITVATNSLTLMALAFEGKTAAADRQVIVRGVCGTTEMLAPVGAIDGSYSVAGNAVYGAVAYGNSYLKRSFVMTMPSSVTGTGSKTCYAQFALYSGPSTAYVRNVTMYVVNLAF